MTTPPSSKIDTIVDECVRRCIAGDRPLGALAQILDAMAIGSKLTDFEFAAIKRLAISRIVEAGLDNE